MTNQRDDVASDCYFFLTTDKKETFAFKINNKKASAGTHSHYNRLPNELSLFALGNSATRIIKCECHH